MSTIITGKKPIHQIDTTLPLGQKLLDAGFKAVTMKEIRERFCFPAYDAEFVKKKDAEMKERGYSKIRGSHREHEGVFNKPEYPLLKKHMVLIHAVLSLPTVLAIGIPIMLIFSKGSSYAPFLLISLVTVVLWNMMACWLFGNKWRRIKYARCSIMDTPLKEYIAEKIPQRCMLNVNLARELGVKEDAFHVLSPYVVAGEETDMLRDPIIVADMGKGGHIEIDFWE